MLQDGEIDLPVSYTHLRAHETVLDLVCRLLLEKKNKPIGDDGTDHARTEKDCKVDVNG